VIAVALAALAAAPLGLGDCRAVATGPGQPIGDPFVPGRPEGYLSATDPEADVPGG
jgi:hypothetical protein